jgi:hypothetical protein
MKNQPRSLMSRRGLLCIGVTVVAGLSAGCGSSGVQTVTTPPVTGGNRSKLQSLEEKANELKANPKLGRPTKRR